MSDHRFGDSTNVPVEKTRAELDQLLGKHGATQRASYQDDDNGLAVIQCRIASRMVRFEVSIPAVKTFAPKSWAGIPGCGEGGSNTQQNRAAFMRKRQEQAARAAWRRLLLVTRAKLELIADGGSTVEREFLADILLPDGRTVGRALAEPLQQAYETGGMPKLLLGPGGS